MRTIYTDRYGIGLFAYFFLALWSSYRALTEEQGLATTIWAAVALWWAYMFTKDLRRRIAARRAGEDTTIIRIVDSAQN